MDVMVVFNGVWVLSFWGGRKVQRTFGVEVVMELKL